jgi:hypothetical protein
VTRFWVDASGAEKLCALGTGGVVARPLNFIVRRQGG